MKPIPMEELKKETGAVLNRAQKERVLITRNGKPSAVMVGVENYDAEDLRLAGSAEFWRMIEERRRGKMIPLEQVKLHLKQRRRRNGTTERHRKQK